MDKREIRVGLLEEMEKSGVLKRTGDTLDHGFVKLIGVETLVAWANSCAGCGRREQVDDGEEVERMTRCGKCRDAFYCGRECQGGELFFVI